MRFERAISQITEQHTSSHFGPVGLPTRKKSHHKGASVEAYPCSFDCCQSSSNTYVLTESVIRIYRIDPSISTRLAKYSCPGEVRTLSVHISPRQNGCEENAHNKNALENEHRFENAIMVKSQVRNVASQQSEKREYW